MYRSRPYARSIEAHWQPSSFLIQPLPQAVFEPLFCLPGASTAAASQPRWVDR
jgi:hypothetical protein